VREEEVVLVLSTLVILGGVSVLWLAMWNRRKLREMEHRERLAMIERGLLPPPEIDPVGFEAQAGLAPEPEPRSVARSRTGGVFLIGLGLALMMLMTFAAGAPEVGIGVGGAFAVLGAAFLFNSMLSASRAPSTAPRMPTSAARPGQPRHTPPGAPPPNVGP
jgi:hypothetical protein